MVKNMQKAWLHLISRLGSYVNKSFNFYCFCVGVCTYQNAFIGCRFTCRGESRWGTVKGWAKINPFQNWLKSGKCSNVNRIFRMRIIKWALEANEVLITQKYQVQEGRDWDVWLFFFPSEKRQLFSCVS